MASCFDIVEQAAPIEVPQLMKLFSEDSYQNKVNLSTAAFRDDEGKPWLLPVVRKTEQQMAADDTLLHEYLPYLGLDQLSMASVCMLLGEDNPAIASGQAFGLQTISGTGALRVAADFLKKNLKYNTFYVSSPSRENHRLVFLDAGFKFSRQYRYWNAKTKGIDIDGLLEDLRAAAENSVIILQACAHNPTGIDPTQEQWEKIADMMEEKKLFPIFDSAWQGFVSGDIDKDAWVVRYFVQRGFELACAQSYSKNFGLYNERVGNLTLVVKNPTRVPACKSQLTWIVRGLYANPPAHGARVVATILTNKLLFQEWKEQVKLMAQRAIEMREALRSELIKLQAPGDWEHIVKQIGIYSYTGLSQRQCEHLIQDFHIYLLKSGRINVCGLTPANVGFVARAMHDAISKFPIEECSCLVEEGALTF